MANVDVGFGQVASPQGNDASGQRLNIPPPQPPGTPARAKQKGDSLVDTQLKKQRTAGLGLNAGNPQILIIQHLGGAKKELSAIAALLPNQAPQLQMMIDTLQQVIPQAMADQLAGIDQSGAPVPPAGGVGGAPQPLPPFPPMAPVAGA